MIQEEKELMRLLWRSMSQVTAEKIVGELAYPWYINQVGMTDNPIKDLETFDKNEDTNLPQIAESLQDKSQLPFQAYKLMLPLIDSVFTVVAPKNFLFDEYVNIMRKNIRDALIRRIPEGPFYSPCLVSLTARNCCLVFIVDKIIVIG